jgi:CTP:molybdopterin cytidylyltransferase MocA
LLEEIDGRPMIRRAVEAAAAWPTVVVASATIAEMLARENVRIVPNGEPDRGMSHSLRLADAAIAPDEPIAIMLGDLPDCDGAAIARVVNAYDPAFDVLVPRAGKRLGHPVIFGPAARAKIRDLADGDTQSTLRDDPSLRKRFLDVDDPRPFEDIDTEDELRARRAR